MADARQLRSHAPWNVAAVAGKALRALRPHLQEPLASGAKEILHAPRAVPTVAAPIDSRGTPMLTHVLARDSQAVARIASKRVGADAGYERLFRDGSHGSMDT